MSVQQELRDGVLFQWHSNHTGTEFGMADAI